MPNYSDNERQKLDAILSITKSFYYQKKFYPSSIDAKELHTLLTTLITRYPQLTGIELKLISQDKQERQTAIERLLSAIDCHESFRLKVIVSRVYDDYFYTPSTPLIKARASSGLSSSRGSDLTSNSSASTATATITPSAATNTAATTPSVATSTPATTAVAIPSIAPPLTTASAATTATLFQDPGPPPEDITHLIQYFTYKQQTRFDDFEKTNEHFRILQARYAISLATLQTAFNENEDKRSAIKATLQELPMAAMITIPTLCREIGFEYRRHNHSMTHS